MRRRRIVFVGLGAAILAGAAAAAVLAATTAGTGHARNPTLKERAGITARMPKWLQHDPVGCVYLPIRVSSDGRFARVGVGFLNWEHAPCSRYTFNGPDWILRKGQLRWRMIARTGAGAAKPACSLRIPSYLLLYGCRR